MKITFLGTRGGIKIRSRAHWRHTITLLEFGRKRILMDAGSDWAKKIKRFDVDAIFITHAHPDHVDALKDGAPCPVYATPIVWDAISSWPIDEQIVVKPGKLIHIGRFSLKAFAVEHSLRAPAVGWRITAGKHTIFYVTDLVSIYEQRKALKNIQLYIGDGASITRPIIRGRDGSKIGHASIKQQLGWCQQEGVPWAIFTHCGSQIVKQKLEVAQEKVALLGEEYGVEADVAYDGWCIKL